MKINIKHQSDIPIYQQIVNYIAGEILGGSLPAGTKLPTIRVLARKNGVSLGTVKHAYDTLLQMGLTEMTQGKGTFVCASERADVTSKKAQAMIALETMIGQMKELSFTNQEIRIYFDLKMREYEEEDYNVTVGIVDCSPEALAEINNQLSAFENIEISEYTLDDLKTSPELMRDDLNLFITTANHYENVLQIIGRDDNLMQMALSESPSTIIMLSKIDPKDRVGIVVASRAFGQVIKKAVRTFSENRTEPRYFVLGEDEHLDAFLQAQDVNIGFTNLHKFANATEQSQLAQYISGNGKYYSFSYEVDEGSLLYLGERIEAIENLLNTR